MISLHERCTTPHVLTEVEGHVKRSRGAGRLRAGWLAPATVLRLDEQWERLEMLDPTEVARFGITDAALLATMRRVDGLTLFTADGGLDDYARRVGASVLSHWELLTAFG